MTLETIQSLFSTTAPIGGALIGLAVALLLLTNGRLLGVSGILFGFLKPQAGEIGWRIAFSLGLLASGGLLALFYPEAFGLATDRSMVRSHWRAYWSDSAHALVMGAQAATACVA